MEELPGLITDLALILVTAAIVTLVFKRIKQPVVLGYIIAGFLVGPYFSMVPSVADPDHIDTLAHIGVIFLLFSLGLEFSFKKLVRVGGAASITALVEIVFITVAGFGLGRVMGWSVMDSIFLGGMLASSSTTITIKALDELGLKVMQFAKVVFGALIVQDIVVILLMVLLSTVAVTNSIEGSELVFTVGKLIFFLAVWLITGIFLIPTLLKRIRKFMDDENLLVLSVGLCLGMVVLAVSAGFSAELGAFIMGSILAETTQAEKIEKLFNPVRDLFASVFFVSIGMMIEPQVIVEYRWPVLWVTLLTIVGKFFSTTLGALISGQPLKQAIYAGTSMSQVGEFTFIVATLGLSLKVISPFLFPIAVGVSAITTFTTPYMIKLSGPIYRVAEKILPAYFKKKLESYSSSAQTIQAESKWKPVLLGYLRIVSVNGVLLLAIMLISFNWIIPFFEKAIENLILSKIASLTVSLLLAAPFLWALIGNKPKNGAFKELWTHKRYSSGPLLVIEIARLLLGILFITFWVGRIFTTIGVFVSIPIIIGLFILFSKKIQLFYRGLETRFLQNLNERELAEQDGNRRQPHLFSGENSLEAWDAHLVEMEVSPHAVYIGKRLDELNWREQFGINVAYIKRGDRVIYAPNRDDRILPYDHVGVIATDEEAREFQKVFEKQLLSESENADVEDIILYKLTVGEDNGLVGKTIRNSQIRERANGLVVGIEQNNVRMANPEPDRIFQMGDIIWIVGEREKLQKLNQRESEDDSSYKNTLNR